jgi:hypothetical protein
MRTKKSLKKQLKKLRERHTLQFNSSKFVEMQTTRRKMIDVLNQLTENFPKWKEN